MEKLLSQSQTMTPTQLREDYYINCLTIEFEGELISLDKARELFTSYLSTGEKDKTDYLSKEMKRVRAEARKRFPDVEGE